MLLCEGMKKYEFKGKQFHEECFCCKVCRQPIGVKTFIPRDQEAVCVPCYEEQYAQRCVKCNGVGIYGRLFSNILIDSNHLALSPLANVYLADKTGFSMRLLIQRDTVNCSKLHEIFVIPIYRFVDF